MNEVKKEITLEEFWESGRVVFFLAEQGRCFLCDEIRKCINYTDFVALQHEKELLDHVKLLFACFIKETSHE